MSTQDRNNQCTKLLLVLHALYHFHAASGTHILDSSREAVASRMMKIIVDVNIYCDHIPADVYHYEIGKIDATLAQSCDMM